jgi:hypothetical protein
VTGRPAKAEQVRDEMVWTYAKDYITLRLAGLGKETTLYVRQSTIYDIMK